MFQDLKKKYKVDYKSILPNLDDYVLFFNKDKILLNSNNNFYQYKDFPNYSYYYGFNVNDKNYFICLESIKCETPLNQFRDFKDERAFIISTGFHIYNWIMNNKFCGKCGKPTYFSNELRALKCDCGNEIFPTIAPAVIAGLLNKNHDKIMLTKYLNGTNYALVAGYNEIGETLEDTVRREVLEEVGLRVCNIKYYKSQPWGKTASCLSGFYADVYEDGPIKVEEDELKFANWFSPEEIDIDDDHISLTREMIEKFKKEKIDL